MPFRFTLPNQIEPTITVTAFLIAVLAGAKACAHAGLARGEGYTLGPDSTVFWRYSEQEGSLKGHNPGKHGPVR